MVTKLISSAAAILLAAAISASAVMPFAKQIYVVTNRLDNIAPTGSTAQIVFEAIDDALFATGGAAHYASVRADAFDLGTGSLEHVDIGYAGIVTADVDWVTGGTVDVHYVETDRLFVDGTNLNVNGYEMAPQETIIVGFSNDMTTAQIQAKINATRKYIPYPNNIFFQFSNGVYTLTDSLTFQGYYGGGGIYIQGDTTEGALAHTNQSAYLDFSAITKRGMVIRNCDGPVIVRQLAFHINSKAAGAGDNTPTGCWFGHMSDFAWLVGCYVDGEGTNYGTGVGFEIVSFGQVKSNYFDNLQYPIVPKSARIWSRANQWSATGSNGPYGIYASQASYVGASEMQPTGSTAEVAYTNQGSMFYYDYFD